MFELQTAEYQGKRCAPTTGPHRGVRFLQTDPSGYAGSGMNLYAYASADPVNMIDPSRLDDNPLWRDDLGEKSATIRMRTSGRDGDGLPGLVVAGKAQVSS